MEKTGKKFLSENEIKARRNAKDTIFLNLFSIPKYTLQLFQTLHPEAKDITEKDIKILTLNPVILNRVYNDLSMLVKDKLLILVEAQSTWTINILIRILMYLASTYKEYIEIEGMNVYSSTKIEIPEPEFYIIYTGNKEFEKDFITLKEDFFNNPNAKIDLTVKVVYTENKEDIIGQYIIFCHVLDEQVKIHGRNKTAVEKTIKICQNDNVLNEYLKTRKKEVIDIMTILFDQDYAVSAYARELEKLGKIQGIKEGKIQGVIEMCKDFGSSVKDTVQKIIEKFNLSEDDATRYVNEFWKEENKTE